MGTGRSAGDITAILSFAVFLIRLFGDQIGSVIYTKLGVLGLVSAQPDNPPPNTKTETPFLKPLPNHHFIKLD